MKPSFLYTGLLATGLLFLSNFAFAQVWMNNYSYRKLITIDKNKVTPRALNIPSGISYQDLIDFPVWLDLQDEDLAHYPGSCGNKMRDPKGLDICFALSSSPDIPLSFEIEHYYPETGKLQCWVKIPSLSARRSASAPTSFYLYYGSHLLHDPQGALPTQVWSNDYIGVWHMNLDGLPGWTRNSKNNLSQQRAIASAGTPIESYQSGLLGQAIALNGTSESVHIDINAGTSFSIATWIKLRALGSAQVIATNDSLGINGLPNGFSLKIDAAGHLNVDLNRSSLTVGYSFTSTFLIEPGAWHYLFVTSTGQDIFASIDGQSVQGRSSSSQRLGQGGALRLGSSKRNTEFLNGLIDLFSIQQGVKGIEWAQTSYLNQKDPSNFYQLSAEEYAIGQYHKFTAAVDDLWQNAANWSTGTVPAQNANILIAAGKKLRIQGLSDFSMNQLILERQATLSLGNDLVLKCKAEVGPEADIQIDEGMALTFEGDIRNHGSISSNGNGGLISAGKSPLQRLYGNGQAEVHTLEVGQDLADQVLRLESEVAVTGTLKLNKGILEANGRLTLMANAEGSAQFLAIDDTTQTAIKGNVRVQTFIHGDFPSPATARGWRLLCSPVYHSTLNDLQHHIYAFQSAMFVTGAGGSSKGFDPSPLNGATIYTHDQALPGSLTQKYQPIPIAAAQIPFGKGIFVFSRGPRSAKDAYQQQLANAPFSNPAGYKINHLGHLHTGDLQMSLKNNNKGQDGDGFHLLGNPYACDVVWNQLLKSNLTEFIWLFDPLNNAYQVSDAPQTIISSGSGFFVRVQSGSSTGSIIFHEHAKRRIRLNSLKLSAPTASVQRIRAILSKGAFEQDFILKLSAEGNDNLTDEDALKIGEGYVNINSRCEGKPLAIEEKMLSASGLSVPLYIKCWEAGRFQLQLEAIDSATEFDIYLKDHISGVSHKVTNGHLSLEFDFNTEQSERSGENRFTLLLCPVQQKPTENPAAISIYPNPFTDQLYLNVPEEKQFKVVFKDIQGRIVKTVSVRAFENMLEGIKNRLPLGAYLIQVFEQDTDRLIRTFKGISY